MSSKTIVQTYLFFDGQCEQALGFYKSALGANINSIMFYRDSPEPLPAGVLQSGMDNKVMHASFTLGSTEVMASDACGAGVTFDGFSLSLSVPTEEEAGKAFDALAEGGEIQMPLDKTFWSPCFGMVKDAFGVSWMVSVPA